MARQAGQKIDDSFRSGALGDPSQAKDIADQLGTLGGVPNPNYGARSGIMRLTILPLETVLLATS